MTGRATLATRLAVGAALVALVPLLALAATFTVLAERAMRKQLDAALLARAQNLAVLVQSSILDPLSRDNALRAWVADPQIAGAFLGPQGRDRCNRFLAAATRGRVVVGGGAARSRGTAGVRQRRGPGLAGGSRRRLVSRRSRRHSRQRGDRPRSARTCPFAGHRRPRRRIASRRAARLVRLGRDRTDDRGPGCAGADVRRRAVRSGEHGRGRRRRLSDCAFRLYKPAAPRSSRRPAPSRPDQRLELRCLHRPAEMVALRVRAVHLPQLLQLLLGLHPFRHHFHVEAAR